MTTRRAVLIGFALLGAAAPRRARAADAPPLIAVAASTRFLADALATIFEATTGVRPELSVASSGALAQQIERGAPFDVFLSANDQWAERAYASGWARDEGFVFALGRLALATRRGGAVIDDPEALLRAFPDGARLALANPEHAPYGVAGRGALDALGVAAALTDRLVYGANVGQAAQFVVSGAAAYGLIAAALLEAPALRARLEGALLDARLHPPIRHRALLSREASPPGKAFFDALARPEARALIEEHGFAAP